VAMATVAAGALLLLLLLPGIGCLGVHWQGPVPQHVVKELIIQVPIPQTGSTSLMRTLKQIYDHMDASDARSRAAGQDLPDRPWMVGKCGYYQIDHVSHCLVHQNPCQHHEWPCPTVDPWHDAPPGAPGHVARPVANGSQTRALKAPKCWYGPVELHLSYSEIVLYMWERGILRPNPPPLLQQPIFFVVLRHPVHRVTSEYHHFMRGWSCCTQFYSKDLNARQHSQNLTLQEYVEHADCPANNRQTWMLAPKLLPAIVAGSSVLGKLKDATPLSPLKFPLFFRSYYGGSPDYVAKLNADEDLLASAKRFLDRCAVVGTTEDLNLLGPHLAASFEAGRKAFFAKIGPPTGSQQAEHVEHQGCLQYTPPPGGIKWRTDRSGLYNQTADQPLFQKIITHNRLDMDLYEYGRARGQEAWRELQQRHGLCDVYSVVTVSNQNK